MVSGGGTNHHQVESAAGQQQQQKHAIQCIGIPQQRTHLRGGCQPSYMPCR